MNSPGSEHKDQEQVLKEQTNSVLHPIQQQLDYLHQRINQVKSSLQEIKRTYMEPSQNVIMVDTMEFASMKCNMHAI